MPSDAAPAAPIRVLHHWACSGGTVISRCIASQPQVVLLSEVHPLAYLRVAQAYPYYFPTDLIQQLSLPLTAPLTACMNCFAPRSARWCCGVTATWTFFPA